MNYKLKDRYAIAIDSVGIGPAVENANKPFLTWNEIDSYRIHGGITLFSKEKSSSIYVSCLLNDFGTLLDLIFKNYRKRFLQTSKSFNCKGLLNNKLTIQIQDDGFLFDNNFISFSEIEKLELKYHRSKYRRGIVLLSTNNISGKSEALDLSINNDFEPFEVLHNLDLAFRKSQK